MSKDMGAAVSVARGGAQALGARRAARGAH